MDRRSPAVVRPLGQQVAEIDEEAAVGREDVVEHTVVTEDIERTRKALHLVRAQPRISSELVDNLNASIHLRAVLTDLFLLSEANRLSRGES